MFKSSRASCQTKRNRYMLLKRPAGKHNSAPYQAFKITLIYLIIGCLWVLLSDRIVRLLSSDPTFIMVVSILKGWFYVIVTSALFFVLIYSELKKVILAKEKSEALNTELEKSNALFTSMMEGSPDIIVFALDQQYRYIAFNQKHRDIMMQIWGQSIEIGTNMLEAIANREDLDRAKSNFDRALSGESFSIVEEYGDEKLSRLYWQNYYSPIASQNGKIVGVTCFVLNITALKRAETQNQFLSYHDKLTGLYNRRFYEDALIRIDREENYPVSIIMGDVNGLKLVNDAFGHHVGDELLKLSAQAINNVCRAGDISARWGGDEFIILLPKTNEEAAEDFIAQVKKQCSNMQVDSVYLDISFGRGIKHGSEESINTAIKNAEDTMYKQKMAESKSMRSQTLKTIMHTLHEKNPREEAHSKRVGELSRRTGIAMGLPEAQIKTLHLAGYLHDIGKIAIEEGLLNKPAKLTISEFESIKQHPEIGCRIIRSSYENSEIAEAILAHHEKWDGTGYPKGLRGEEIPVFSRIISISDSYDAMVSVRPYKETISPQQAVQEIIRSSGTQFDPEIVNIFIETVLSNDIDPLN